MNEETNLELRVPHGPQAAFLSSVTRSAESWVECCAVVPCRGVPRFSDGSISAAVALELMAQAAAAYAGVRGEAHAGLIVAARNVETARWRFYGGEEVVIRAELVGGDERMRIFFCEMQQQGSDEAVAKAKISIFLVNETETDSMNSGERQ